ncbi:MAG: tripartite tricarboxylate transporter substrate binding protein [Bdellovibrionales bacterium]|nr:tripartite tricarboxylate transporter substrate binding protein [Ramlibacter sp.]
MKHLFPLARLAPLLCALGLAISGAGALGQSADGFPSKQIKLVVPFTPGSGVDTMARLIAEKLPGTLGGSAFVDNRPGASGTIGSQSVAKAPPDGLTLLVSPTTHVITSAVRKVSYNPITDFAPVGEFARGSFLVVVPASSPAKTFAELVQLLKTSQGQSTYSSAGIASTVHLYTETLLLATGAKARHIPGKGVTGAMMDVLQAQVDFTVAPVELALPQIKAGKVRALAQTASSRSRLVADVPTVSESGYPGFEATYWIGVYAPAGTPAAIVARLNRSLNEVLARTDVLQILESNGMEAAGGSPEHFLQRNKADLARFTAVAKGANITAD